MQCLQLIVNSAWRLLTGWQLPGLGFTPAQFLCFIIIFKLVLNFIISLFNSNVLDIAKDPDPDAIKPWDRSNFNPGNTGYGRYK